MTLPAIRKKDAYRLLLLLTTAVLAGSAYFTFRVIRTETAHRQDKTSESPTETFPIRANLPPERTFLGKMSDEKDGVTRVQVRGIVKQWGDDKIDLLINNNESVRVKLTSEIQYECYPAVMASQDGGGVPFSQGYFNLLYQDGIGAATKLEKVRSLIPMGNEVIVMAQQASASGELHGYIIVTSGCGR